MELDISDAKDYAIVRGMAHDYSVALKSVLEITSAPGMNMEYWDRHINAIQTTLEKIKAELQKYEAQHPEMFPKGKAFEDDEGVLNIGIGETEKGLLMLDFGKHVKWLAMEPQEAINFAGSVLARAMQMTFEKQMQPPKEKMN
jgi:hypothetical protein